MSVQWGMSNVLKVSLQTWLLTAPNVAWVVFLFFLFWMNVADFVATRFGCAGNKSEFTDRCRHAAWTAHIHGRRRRRISAVNLGHPGDRHQFGDSVNWKVARPWHTEAGSPKRSSNRLLGSGCSSSSAEFNTSFPTPVWTSKHLCMLSSECDYYCRDAAKRRSSSPWTRQKNC
jgi:hypothetical protein